MRRVRVRGEGEEIVKLHNYRAASEGGNASPAGGHLMYLLCGVVVVWGDKSAVMAMV